nr:hypothetical protein [Pedobacter sp. ASV19]
MNCKKRIGIYIFTLGVFMFLLRPCLAYQLSRVSGCKTNAAQAWNLSQRLIKKKDDHHMQHAEVATVKVFTQKTPVYLVKILFNALVPTGSTSPVQLLRCGLYHCFQPGAP